VAVPRQAEQAQPEEPKPKDPFKPPKIKKVKSKPKAKPLPVSSVGPPVERMSFPLLAKSKPKCVEMSNGKFKCKFGANAKLWRKLWEIFFGKEAMIDEKA